MTTPQQSDDQPNEAVRVLLVDDQQLLRESFKQLLELTGGAVEVLGAAGDGVEAVAAVERFAAAGRAPQVVLMDVRMPRMNGVEATRQIVARWPAVRVVILSTFDDEEYIVEGLRAGACGYLLKDTSSAELLSAIRAARRGESPIQPSVAAKLVAHVAGEPPPTATAGVHPYAPPPAREGGAGGAATSGGASIPTPAKGEVASELTEREREILRLIARGASNREIGETLFITEGTVKNHVSNILAKLALRDRTQAAVYAHDHGLA